MTVQQFLETTAKDDFAFIRPHAVCEDGYAISIQAGNGLHSQFIGEDGEIHIPFVDDIPVSAIWKSVEVGILTKQSMFNKQEIEILKNSNGIEDDSEWSDRLRIFAYVDIESIEELVKLHGGISHPDPDINLVAKVNSSQRSIC